uniref:polysaccharide biosynthesis C-terminal domain-containing protein n=1 Tax=Clostridium perfringens TaxID=1502 RepID=UPI002ACDCC0D
MLIAMTCTMGLFFLAGPIMKVIFPGKWDGILILKYLALSVPFIIITQTTTSIMQGIGHYIRPIINLFIGCIVKVILTFTLVPMANINIYGAVIASISAYLVSTILNLVSLKKRLKLRLSIYQTFIKPIIASLAMIAGVLATYLFLFNKTSSNGFSCLVAI